jgi:hypothetical protein
MKTNQVPVLHMTLLISSLLISMLWLTACQKNETDDALAARSTIITADDASAVIQSTLSSETGGLATTLADVGTLTGGKNSASYCGKSKDSTVTKAKTSTNGQYSYSYSQAWSWLLTCSVAKIPANLSYQATLTGQYKSPKVTSADQGSTTLAVSGLEVLKSNYVINGSYARSGTETVAVSTSKTLSSTVNLALTDIQVNKSTLQIQSGGTATLTIDGKSSTGQSYSFTGSVLFTGNGTATITINGKTYLISI